MYFINPLRVKFFYRKHKNVSTIYIFPPHWHDACTLVSQIVEHTEIDEHLEQIAENLIVEHLIYTIFIATNNRTSGIFFHCVNSQTRLTIRDTRVGEILSYVRQELIHST